MESGMFCFQCQEAAKGVACTTRGVCGKDSVTSASMDMLLFVVRGISILADTLRKNGKKVPEEVNYFVTDALFSTITNANFDEESILDRAERGMVLRQQLMMQLQTQKIALSKVEELTWSSSRSEYLQKGKTVGVLREKDENVRSLKELVVYGLKGISAYHDHAMRLGHSDEEIHAFVQESFARMTLHLMDLEELTSLVIGTGEMGVRAMALLDKANTERFGHPAMTKVRTGTRRNPGILISGHDLHDMEDLLRQTEGTGVDVYTHCEMLPAHAYPAFKKYAHFVGNYGNSWWKQREEFDFFNGPIVFTTNCIVPPFEGASYKERMFTSNATGYPGCKYIPTGADGHKNYAEVIAMAKRCPAPIEIERGEIVTGFAHHQISALGDKLVNAVKKGTIKKLVVMAGCDGRMNSRTYYTDFAKALPHDTVILTAGCAKYRYNKLNLGEIEGISRVLDAGQCNDSYSIALTALKMKELFKVKDINELPIVYNIAWYEQKAVIVLLALLSLGIKNIHLGPTLPAFLSPHVAKVLVERFGIAGITTVENDKEKMGLTQKVQETRGRMRS